VWSVAEWCRKYDVQFKINTGASFNGQGTRYPRRVVQTLTCVSSLHAPGLHASVVNRKNHLEDMSAQILELRPVRWKIFQCLPVTGENIRGVEEKGTIHRDSPLAARCIHKSTPRSCSLVSVRDVMQRFAM
jgi:hypothetical protein